MNKKTNKNLIIVIILMAIVGIAWIYARQEKQEQPAVVEEPAEIALMFGFTPNVGYAPFYAAAANGYYDEEGLDVSFQSTTEGGVGVIKQIGANKIEFGYAGDSTAVTGRTQDVNIVAIQRIIQKSFSGIYSKENLNITKPEDLIGKKIALPAPAGPPADILKIILTESGATLDQTNPLYVGGAIISTHLAGNADAFVGFIPQKVIAENISQVKMNEISASDYTTIGRSYLFTSDNMVSEHSEIVRKFVRATQKGLEYTIEHPEKAVDAYLKYDPDAAEKKMLHLSLWKAMIEKGFDKDANGNPIFHLPSEDKWAEKQDQMFDVGAIDKKTDVSKMYTDKFLPE